MEDPIRRQLRDKDRHCGPLILIPAATLTATPTAGTEFADLGITRFLRARSRFLLGILLFQVPKMAVADPEGAVDPSNGTQTTQTTQTTHTKTTTKPTKTTTKPTKTAHPSLPSPPFVLAPGLANLRDAGGYAIDGQPGKAVRRGILFRSADLTQLGDEGVSTLQRLGITHVFDLRSDTELAKAGGQPPKTWDGAARVYVPVFTSKDYSPEALAVRFRHYSDGPEVSWSPCVSSSVVGVFVSLRPI